jgi:hypothetical protein
MTHKIEDFQNNPSWIRSIGEKLDKIHFRNGHWHAECDPKTGICKTHYDKDDPYESITSLIKHMSASNLGLSVLLVVGIGVLDQVLTGGQIRKSVLKSLSS